MWKRSEVMRRTLLTLTLLAGGQALAQDGAGGTRAVRISGGSWTELDAAAEAGFLIQYQYAQGVSVLPAPQGLWRETLPANALDGADLLLVDAEDSSALELDEGVPLEDILRHVMGSEGGVLRPADTGGEELKPQAPQLVLVLPAGTLAELFPRGGAAEVEPLLRLEPQRLLGVRPETPCDGKCAGPLEATQVVAEPVADGAELALPERVLANEPPDTAPQPLLNRGGVWIAPVAASEAGTLVRAEAGSGADLYQWSVVHADGQRWSLGVTTTSAVEFTLPAEWAQADTLTLSAIAFTWDNSRQTWAAKQVPGTGSGGGGGGTSINYVGVIPESGSCPKSSDLLTFHMDDEDKNNANSRSGWIGGITSNNNTTWRFCRVDASKFKPLSKDSIRQNHYAVLMLGSCPAGSLRFSRYFDNEDKNNANWANANFVWAPNSSDRNTNLVFCVFRGAGASGSTMTDMPNLGFSYGVLAASDFSKRLSTGWVHTDDEDSNNQNSYADPHGQYGDVSRFISVGSNTTVNLAKVR